MFPPLFCSMFSGKPCVGIVTKADLASEEQIERAKQYLKDAEEAFHEKWNSEQAQDEEPMQTM